jgi:N-acetylmuramoyl-L-alanine amidase
MSRYAVRIGSAFALLLSLAAIAPAFAASGDRANFTFEGTRIVFGRLVPHAGGRAVSIDDPGLRSLFELIGATVTWQTGERYVLITTAEPVVISFAMGDRRYDVGPVTQTAAFAPFMQDGHAYVPFDELLHGLNLAAKADGAQTVLQPQLTSVDIQSTSAGSKLVAHGGMPLDAKIVSDAGGKIVIAFDGVGSMLPPSRTLSGGPVKRIDARTEGGVTHPRAIVTLFVTPGTTHTPAGTDDQRDFTIGFNGAPASQPIAAAQPPAAAPSAVPSTEPEAIDATPEASPQAPVQPSSGPVQVTSVQTQAQNGAFVVRIAVDGNAAYDWHRLRPPDNRFWIDIHGARLAVPSSDQAGNDLVTAVRTHQQNPDTVRIALSLADFNSIDVTPDATGVTISVNNTVADDTAAPRTGAGTIGDTAVAYASPAPSGDQWKFQPRPSPSPYKAANPRLIVIDPGHGGSDVGSYRGDAVEKTLSLDMSKRLRDILVSRGWQVIMTRETDKDVFGPNDSAAEELQARDDIANNNGARLFVSIHVNAFINSGPHGATVYYYKPNDFALAQAVERRIASENVIKNDGTVKDKLYVVHHATMPATLVETAFISNPDDRQLLQSPAWRQKMALAIADGIADYAGSPPPPGSVSGQ